MLAYAKAGSDFESHRRIADSVMLAEIAFQGWLTQPDLCIDLARRSYATCSRLLHKSWPCYDELADQLPNIIICSRQALSDHGRVVL